MQSLTGLSVQKPTGNSKVGPTRGSKVIDLSSSHQKGSYHFNQRSTRLGLPSQELPYEMINKYLRLGMLGQKKEARISIDKYSNEELESFARCLRECVLIGIDYLLGLTTSSNMSIAVSQASNEQHIKVEEEDNYRDVPPGFTPRIKEANSTDDLSEPFSKGQSVTKSLTMYQNSPFDLQASLSKGKSVPKCLTMYQNN
ncbi:hypothetical protein M9H77_21657 [Catharanthus roseus]|uniref:Uncharacterized protein n=1 Tax=Catharanthus roseus TaxID=4058 RepID=A0ACC0ANB4_CATRO|nr:hypothetical protein M9H77_21657 [Catharanthus roseus]